MVIIETMKQGITPLIFDLHELDVYFDGVNKLDPHQKELFKTDRISIRTDAEDLTWQQVVTESGTTNIASIRKTSPKADIILATFYGYTTGVWLPDQVIAQIEASPAYDNYIEEITNPESTPINPIQISEEDKILLKAHISTESRILPGSYFLKSSFKTVSWEEGDSIFQSGSSERDISYLVPYCLGITEIDAIRLIMEAHELQPDEARAAWVFVNRYPISSLAITAKNTPEYVDQMAQRVTQESNPRTELSI